MVEKKASLVTVASQRQPLGHLRGHRYVRPPDDHPIYHLVGRVAAQWARLEYSLDRIIWSLSYTISPRAACLTVQLMGCAPRYRAIKAQLQLRSLEEPQFEKFIKQINKLETDTRKIQERRNRIVHDPWLVDTNHDQPAQFKIWPGGKLAFGIRDQDVRGIKATIASIDTQIERAEALFRDINQEITANLAQKHP